MSKLDELSTTEQINTWIERDALNVALAQLRAAQATLVAVAEERDDYIIESGIWRVKVEKLQAELAECRKLNWSHVADLRSTRAQLAEAQAEIKQLQNVLDNAKESVK